MLICFRAKCEEKERLMIEKLNGNFSFSCSVSHQMCRKGHLATCWSLSALRITHTLTHSPTLSLSLALPLSLCLCLCCSAARVWGALQVCCGLTAVGWLSGMYYILAVCEAVMWDLNNTQEVLHRSCLHCSSIWLPT